MALIYNNVTVGTPQLIRHYEEGQMRGFAAVGLNVLMLFVQALQVWLDVSATENETHQLSSEDLVTKTRLFALLRLATQSSLIAFSDVQVFLLS